MCDKASSAKRSSIFSCAITLSSMSRSESKRQHSRTVSRIACGRLSRASPASSSSSSSVLLPVATLRPRAQGLPAGPCSRRQPQPACRGARAIASRTTKISAPISRGRSGSAGVASGCNSSKVQSVDQRMRLGMRCRLSPTADVLSHTSGAAMCHNNDVHDWLHAIQRGNNRLPETHSERTRLAVEPERGQRRVPIGRHSPKSAETGEAHPPSGADLRHMRRRGSALPRRKPPLTPIAAEPKGSSSTKSTLTGRSRSPQSRSQLGKPLGRNECERQ